MATRSDTRVPEARRGGGAPAPEEHRGAGAMIPAAFALAAYVLALLQSPGMDTADTKIGVHVDPARFMSHVASVWSNTEGLGHVQGGQYSGYLWPMGPFFALGHLIGLSDWVVERLWLGTLLALAAWGMIRLLDALLDGRRGIAHVVGGATFALNPYVVVFTSRATVFLLAYAALPWLLLAVHRGVRNPTRWWWPAAFALITTSTGGGVNATVTALVLLGPLLLALYEGWLGGVSFKDVARFGWRVVVATALSSVWWAVPLLVQNHYGLNFLRYTEQLGSIWSTASLSESLRLMGYWTSYLGVGFSTPLIPSFGNAETMLFNPFAVAASLLVPALALAGYLWTRRWRYGPFALMLALVALLVMSVGYPDGTILRKGLNFIFNHLTAIQFLRTTYKAGPLLAIAVALLAGAGAAELWRRCRPQARVLTALVATGLLVASTLPFFQGNAIELTYKAIPSAWRLAGAELNSQLSANARAVVLPGQAYAYYTWGGTVDPVLPSLTDRQVAVRNVPPFDDLHATDFLWTVDDLVQQQRLLPGELGPLLDLMSARAVITATDDDDALSGALAPAPAAHELRTQSGFERPTRSYGPVRTFVAPQSTAERAVRLPEVRRYDVPARGIVRIEPAGAGTVIDGSAAGVADLAALGMLPSSQPIRYAGDLSPAEIRTAAAAGGPVLITDSNRRRVFVASRILQNYGWTVPANEGFTPDAALLDPFATDGSAAQTVEVFEGARDITAPYDPEIAEFPEHRPYAAFDGNPHTSWLADTTLPASSHWIQVDLDRPSTIGSIAVLPDNANPAVQIRQVTIDGEPFALHRGWNVLPVRLHRVSALRITITHVHAVGPAAGTGFGFAEIRIPGLHVHELLRPPTLAENALRGTDLIHTPLAYVFERTTAADPLQRRPAPERIVAHGSEAQAEAALIRQAQDPETGLARRIDPPVARSWTVGGLADVSPTAPDPALDRLAGTNTHGAVFTSSGRLDGRPAYRASSAFDGNDSTAWVAPFAGEEPAWIAWSTPRAVTLTRLRLVRSILPSRFPTLVRISTPSASTPAMAVPASGTVVLAARLRGRSFKLTVLRAGGSSRPSVAIGEVLGTGAPVASSSLASAIRGRCGDLMAHAAGRRLALRLTGAVAALDAGDALGLRQCGPALVLPASPVDFTIAPAVVEPLLVALRSAAPNPLANAALPAGGNVLSVGHTGTSSYSDVRVRVRGPAWLVLGQSYNAGWHATCDGRSLGPPQVIDVFANGWRVGPGCTSVSITFAPQHEIDLGFIIGAIACLVLALVLVAARPGSPVAPAAWFPNAAEPRPWSLPKALGAGVIAAIVLGIVFALRAGVVLGPLLALILWRGVRARTLIAAAGALLVIIVPLVYLVFPGLDEGGYDNGYVSQHLGAHWIVVLALFLLIVALWRELPSYHRSVRGDLSAGADP
jgi:hypothetical protein